MQNSLPQPLKILHVVKIPSNRPTGPAVSVTSLVNAMNQIAGVTAAYSHPSVVTLKEIESVDLIIFNGFWVPHFWWLGLVCKCLGTPYIISPRSNLMRRSFSRSRWKKLVGLCFGGLIFIRNARRLHFLTEEERTNSYHFKKKTIICPNGYDLDPLYCQPNETSVRNSGINEVKAFSHYLLFLGRLDIYHKGIDILVAAIDRAKDLLRSKGMKVVIAGDDSRGESPSLIMSINRLGIEDIIDVIPRRIAGGEKHALIKNANAFLHVSRYEGEPQAVLEAIALKTPVILSRGTNMSAFIRAHSLGVCTEGTSVDVEKALIKFFILEDEGFFSRNADWFCMRNRTWSVIAKDITAKYLDILTK